MNHTRQQYENALNKFIAASPEVWKRYNHSAAAEVLLVHLTREQQPPSLITVELGMKRWLVRIDGGSFQQDTQRELQRITARIDQPDLTKSEIEFFQSLHPQELMQRYWEDNGLNRFAVRYNKAAKELGFKLPGRPAAAADDDVEPVVLSAADYHSMPSARIIQRLRAEPGFKKAIDRLIARGEI